MSHPLGHAARLTLALVAATWGAPGARAQAVDSEDVDELVERTMKAFEVPGAAIAIVRGDVVVHLKGYGVKSIGDGDPVTPSRPATGSTTGTSTPS